MTRRLYWGVRHGAPSALSFRASLSESFHFRHVLQTSRDGSAAKPRSMLNKAIFDPWQRSLFSRQRTPGKEPLLAGNWDPQSSAFFDVRVCHPNAESYKDQEPQQIYPIHENDKKRLYSRRVLDVEHGAFTPLVFTTTGGMGKECIRYHSRLAQLIAAKKGEQYSQTISWIREGNPLRSFSRPWFAFEDRG